MALLIYLSTHYVANNLTSIDAFSCLGGLQVTHTTAVREVLGSFPDSGKDFIGEGVGG